MAFSNELQQLIDATLADGVITPTERRVLHKRAAAEGVDLDELDVIIDGKLAMMQQQQAPRAIPVPPPTPLASTKYGNVLKCPSCGAQVKAGAAVCEACGYAFSGVSATNAARDLQARLDAYNSRKQTMSESFFSALKLNPDANRPKLDLIANFPVPNTRADLLDLLSMAEPQMNANGPRNGESAMREEDMSYGYWLLYNNCINKARISFSNDPDFKHFFERYDQEVKKTKGFSGFYHSIPRPLKGLLWMVIIYALLGLLIWGIIACSRDSDSKPARTETVATRNVDADDSSAGLDAQLEGIIEESFEGEGDDAEADAKADVNVKDKLKEKYDYVYSESDGMFKVELNGKKGYCDAATGKVIVEPKYDYIYSWDDDGMAKVEKGGKKGFINKQGKEVVPCEYDYIYSWDDGLAKVEKGNKKGYINKQGKLVSPLE